MIINHGEVPLTIFASGETPVVPDNTLVLPAGEEITIAVAELGPAGSRYIYIKNDNPDLAGVVEIIEVTGA